MMKYPPACSATATLADPPPFSGIKLSRFLLFLSLFLVPTRAVSSLSIDSGATPGAPSSLQYHLCGPGASEISSDTALLLSGGIHYLEEGPFCLLQNLANVSIQGQLTAPRTVVQCVSEREERRGLAFFNISSLHLSNLDIVNCGREVPAAGLPDSVNSTFAYLGPLQRAVMIATHCIDVTVVGIGIHRCHGFGILFINSLGETIAREVSVTNSNSQVSDECSQPQRRSDMLCSGNGLVFIFSDTDITNELTTLADNYTASLLITNSSFANNINFIPPPRLVELWNIIAAALAADRILLTGGLSVAIYTGQRNYSVNIQVTNTSIASNRGNTGNCILIHYNMIPAITTQFDGITFTNNTVVGMMEVSLGAGLLVIVTIFDNPPSTFRGSQGEVLDIVEVGRSRFAQNTAVFGGAIMVHMTMQSITNLRVVVKETTFIENVAMFGSALYAFQFQALQNSKMINMYLEDIVALRNTYPGAAIADSPPEDTGVFMVSHSGNLTLAGNANKGCYFRENTLSAVMVERTNVVLRGRISFEDNRGFRGGALSLVDSSILFIHNSSDISFTRNTAFQEGGAVYINTLGFSLIATCAIQVLADQRVTVVAEELKLLDLSIVFSNNSALLAGNSVYGNPLYFCLFLPNTGLQPDNMLDFNVQLLYETVFVFKDTVRNGLSEVNSREEVICICQNATFSPQECSLHFVLEEPVIPGDTFEVFLNPIDIVRNPVNSILFSFAHSGNLSNPVELDLNQDVQTILGLSNCSPVQFTIFAPENVEISLELFATIGGLEATVELNTTVCPPGFTLELSGVNSDRLACVCSDFITERMESTCNTIDYTIARPTNYWVGTKSNKNGVPVIQFVTTCPIHYCRDDITNIDLRIPDQVCRRGRTGTLCGACGDGLSSVFGAPHCWKCSDAWLATIPLFALMGALIVVLAFFLDFTITHGLITSLVFYANIVMVNANIFFQGNQTGFLFWYLTWVNMDLGIPLCFYDGMTETAKLGLQYVFPGYVMLLIVIIIALSQYSALVQRILSQLDGIHILVSMFYLLFLKFFRTVIDTITFVSIVSEDSSSNNNVVWFFDGNQRVDQPVTIFLIFLAVLTLTVFIIPYTLSFLFSNCIQRRVNSTRLNAYFDASLAPYKDRYRFWFGARLLLTATIYIIVANRGTNNPTYTLTLELSFLVGFAIVQAYIHPFKKLRVALLDMFFLLNLIGLTLATSYTIQKEERYGDQEIFVGISFILAFLANLGIILWHVTRKLRKHDRVKLKMDEWVGVVKNVGVAVRERLREIMTGRENKGKKEAESVPENGRGPSGSLELAPPQKVEPPPSTMISLQDMAAAPDDCQPQHISSSQLREPVLDFID